MNPVVIAVGVIACLAFPPLAVAAILILVAAKVITFVVEESPRERVAGARRAERWFANV
jgi:hypothetical protein